MNPQLSADDEIAALWAATRKAKKARRRDRAAEPTKLNINSLMDAFTIILCFLLKSFGSDPVQIRESDELKLPRTTESVKGLEDAIVIAISTKAIMVQDVKVADLRDGRVDESLKRDGMEGLLINPLYDALKEKVQHLKMIGARTNNPFKGMALVVAHNATSYRLVTEVLYTAGQAEFEKFKFVAAEGESIPGPILRIGNTNTRVKFGNMGPGEFGQAWTETGSTHHFALGVGHQLGKIEKLAKLLDIELAVVTR